MPYIIAEPCVGTCDTACVEVCPVDCIHGPYDKEGAGAEAKEDGFIPLILRSKNPEKEVTFYNKNKPAGWYSYNTSLDYLPFLAYCLSI